MFGNFLANDLHIREELHRAELERRNEQLKRQQREQRRKHQNDEQESR